MITSKRNTPNLEMQRGVGNRALHVQRLVRSEIADFLSVFDRKMKILFSFYICLIVFSTTILTCKNSGQGPGHNHVPNVEEKRPEFTLMPYGVLPVVDADMLANNPMPAVQETTQQGHQTQDAPAPKIGDKRPENSGRHIPIPEVKKIKDPGRIKFADVEESMMAKDVCGKQHRAYRPTSAGCVTEFEKEGSGPQDKGKAIYRDANEFQAFFGLHDFKKGAEESIKVKKFYHHEHYFGRPSKSLVEFENDTALVGLERAIKFNDKIRPACRLISQSSVTPEPGTYCTVAGWGENVDSSRLGQWKMKVLEKDRCENNGRSGMNRAGWGASYKHDMMFCARRSTKTRSSQKSPETILSQNMPDSVSMSNKDPGTTGSSLACYHDNEERWYYYGIALQGKARHKFGKPPSLYTRASHFAKWTEDSIPVILQA